MPHPSAARSSGRRGRAASTTVFVWACALLAAGEARALELHSFIDDNCRASSGVLVRVDDVQVQLITLDGVHVALPVESVRTLAVHKVLENPLGRITVDEQLRALAREIRTGTDEVGSFVGWPVGFYDQLVIFFDTEGRSHVLEPQDIRSVRPARRLDAEIRPTVWAKAALDFPPELLLCSLPRAEGGLRPSRVLGDRIKVDDYLAKLRDRYNALDSFEERTRVYPRPLVFDPTMRLGLAYFSGTRGELVKYMPLYFQWSSGRPYRFQSHTTLGVAPSAWLPVVEPTISFQSDVKSHFFTASFVGHLPSLPAGSQAFRDEIAIAPQTAVPAVDELYNYLVLMGGDYGPFSVSGGVMYRSVRVAFAKYERREISADSATPVVRLMWVSPRVRARALYFRTRQDRLHGEGWRGLDGAGGGSAYRLALDSVRAGVDIDLRVDLSLSLDQVLTFGSYRESSVASMDILNSLSSMVMTAQFSRYVAIKVYINYLAGRYEIGTDVGAPPSIAPGSASRSNSQLGGALEFLF